MSSVFDSTVAVPDLARMTATAAEAALLVLGLVPQNLSFGATSGGAFNGSPVSDPIVTVQSITAAEEVPIGTTVFVEMGRGLTYTSIPA